MKKVTTQYYSDNCNHMYFDDTMSNGDLLMYCTIFVLLSPLLIIGYLIVLFNKVDEI